MVRRGRQKEVVLLGWDNGCCSHHTAHRLCYCAVVQPKETLCPSATADVLLMLTRLSLVGVVSSCALAKLSLNSASIFFCFDIQPGRNAWCPCDDFYLCSAAS